jgi:predicted metal-binding membrane protein
MARDTENPGRDGAVRVVAAGLLIAVLLCWWWIVVMAVDMYGPMTGAAAWMMTERWDGPHTALLFGMWSAMMLAMMLPSAAPAIASYGRDLGGASRGTLLLWLFVAGYAVVWVLFGLAATFVQRSMHESRLLTPMMEPATTALAGGLLLAAGAYQLLPFKRDCLASCRGLERAEHSHDRTVAGAFRAGLRNGGACLASNWLLMLLLFAGGVMNLAVILVLTGIVLLEKIAPLGAWFTRLTGGLLVGLALWVLARSYG